MSLPLDMDHHVSRVITDGLRKRGINVLTAQEDGTREFEDSLLLDRATALRRILFTRDDDFLRETTRRLRNGQQFYSVVYAHQLHVSIGDCIAGLELICRTSTPQDALNKVYFLPI